MELSVGQKRAALAEAYPSYRFQDTALYSDKRIIGIYRDKKAKLPRFQYMPVELVNRDGYLTVIMERRMVG